METDHSRWYLFSTCNTLTTYLHVYSGFILDWQSTNTLLFMRVCMLQMLSHSPQQEKWRGAPGGRWGLCQLHHCTFPTCHSTKIESVQAGQTGAPNDRQTIWVVVWGHKSSSAVHEKLSWVCKGKKNCLTTNTATRLPMASSSHWSFWVEQKCYLLMVDYFSHYRGVCKLVSTKTLLTPSWLYLSQFYRANLVFKTK